MDSTAGPPPPAAPPRAHVIATRLVVILPFLACVTAGVWIWQCGFMGWGFVYLAVGGWLLTGLGITVGYHRMVTHRAFETSRFMHKFWTVLGGLAMQGSTLGWCSVHRKHHQFSDVDGDPHSPRLPVDGAERPWRAFVYAHTGWISGPALLDEDMQKRYVPDLLADPFHVWINDRYYYLLLTTLTVPAAIGWLIEPSGTGVFLGFLWGGLIRLFVTNHASWSVNTVCHLFGRQPYSTRGNSRNNLLMALLTHGEGWHNNHHAFPKSARHGLHWWQLDVSWLCIRAMQLVGLAWNVQVPDREMLTRKRAKADS